MLAHVKALVNCTNQEAHKCIAWLHPPVSGTPGSGVRFCPRTQLLCRAKTSPETGQAISCVNAGCREVNVPVPADCVDSTFSSPLMGKELGTSMKASLPRRSALELHRTLPVHRESFNDPGARTGMHVGSTTYGTPAHMNCPGVSHSPESSGRHGLDTRRYTV